MNLSKFLKFLIGAAVFDIFSLKNREKAEKRSVYEQFR